MARLAGWMGMILVQVVSAMPIQGTMADAGLSGSRSVQFKIYTDSLGGNLVWSESQNLEFTQGHFQTNLGQVNALPTPLLFKNDLWLDVEVVGLEHFKSRMLLPTTARSLSAHTTYGRLAYGVSIDDGLLVKSINGLKDHLRFSASGGMVLTQEANEMKWTLDPAFQKGKVKLSGQDQWGALNPAVFVRSDSLINLGEGVVHRSHLADATVGSAKLEDGAVLTSKLADGSVDAAKLSNGSVTLAKISSGGVSKVLSTDGSGTVQWSDQSSFASSSLSSGKILVGSAGGLAVAQSLSGDASLSSTGVLSLGSGVVSSTVLADGSVSTAKLADGAVLTSKLADGSVDANKLSSGSVTLAKISSGGVSKVLSTDGSGTVQWSDQSSFASSSLSSGKILVGSAGGLAVAQSLSGDASLSSTGVLSLGSGVVSSTVLADGSVSTAKLADGAVSTAKLATQAVTSVKIADGAVDANKLSSGSVTLAKISSGGVSKVLSTDGSGTVQWSDQSSFASSSLSSGKILVGSAGGLAVAQSLSGDASLSSTGVLSLGSGVVSSTVLADGSVSTAKLADGAVSTAKLATQAVTSVKIADGAVDANKLSSGSVTLAKISSGGVSKVLSTDGSGTVQWSDQSSFASSSLSSGKILVGSAGGLAVAQSLSGDASLSSTGVLSLGSGVVSSTVLADGSVSTAKLADGTVTSSKLADGAVLTSKLADGSVDAAKLSNGSVTLAKISSGGVSKVLSTDGSGTVQWSDQSSFASSSLSSGKILVGSAGGLAVAQSLSGDASLSSTGVLSLGSGVVSSTVLADGSVSTAKLVNGSVDANKLSSGSVTLAKISSGGVSKILSTDGSGTVQWSDQSAFASSSLSSGKILVGSAGGLAVAQSLSGDASLSSTGVLSLGSGVVSSTVLADGSVSTAKLADGAVSTAKLATQAVTSVKIADGAVSGAKIAMGGDAQGDLLYYNGTSYVRLGKGNAGDVLTMNGGATAPSWSAPAGGGGASALSYGFSHGSAGGANDQLGANGGVDGGSGAPHVILVSGTISKCAYSIDLGGVGKLQYSINGGAWTDLSGALALPSAGLITGLSIAVSAGDRIQLRFTDWFNLAQATIYVQ